MIDPAYRAQVSLLLRVLPEVSKESSFALKGGTGINLFVREMPRLSVDIDLTYLPLTDRATALQEISEALRRIKARLDRVIPGSVNQVLAQGGGQEAKLACRVQQATIKVEVNTVIRGNLWPIRQLPLVQSAQDEFQTFVTTPVVSNAELFGGKLCAALDRQHPRDLFDVQQLLDHSGLTDDIRLGFVASLLSHTRPMNEVLRPQFQDQRSLFATQFAGMTIEPYTYGDYEETRKTLATEIRKLLQDEDRSLLLSFKRGEPQWDLFPIPALKDLPAVRWKLANIERLKTDRKKHAQQLKALEQTLGN